MAEAKVETRGAVDPGKKQVNWRVYVRIVNALQADADKRGFPSVPALLNHMLTLHYFGGEQLKG